jgi:hypothetical protein
MCLEIIGVFTLLLLAGVLYNLEVVIEVLKDIRDKK